ncbi:DNA cytosine methyltransferase [Novosphingobium sp. SG707]|uniref:DNA cytosine methyltransferase n=1 Tax=Novosphingobium sp. SG707 TaxID=2586996 RepID=UPI001446A66E|nr:DNA cytosine methyltransferase [Novosphingobium sp. SG707]NKJ02972.1 DNA (cytosine-5)-methyltransferase 1 [Novosphingobium sp. SG707]
MTFRALDLFCGTGGLTRGLEAAGFEVVGAVDSWEPAIRSYRANFDHDAWLTDAGDLDAAKLAEMGLDKPVDVVVGGPPCQGFSIQRIGKNFDDRNDLVACFGKTVISLRPKLFIMENVPGLLGHRGRDHFRRFESLLSEAGYSLTWKILDASDYGVPQMRRRVIVVGWPNAMKGEFAFPEPITAEPHSVRSAIGDLPEPPQDHSPLPGDPLHRRMKLSELNLRRLRYIPPGGGFEDLPVELRVNAHKDGAARIGHRSVYGRLSFDKPAATITARFDSFTRGRFAHPEQDRNITLREGARLQGFPDDHVFLGTQDEIAALIGNAVPPPLAQAVGAAALRFLHMQVCDDPIEVLATSPSLQTA